MASFAATRSVIRPSTSGAISTKKVTPARSFAKHAMSQKTTLASQRSLVVSAGPMGDKWYPGAKAPAYLDGSMAGDYGYDPLRMGANASILPYYREAELMNGRWAMMGVLGCIASDALELGNWWEAGSQDYGFSTTSLIGVQVLVMGFLEFLRIQGYKETGETGFFFSYPFDPLGLANNPESKKSLQEKELKNGRLAMFAFLGFASQAAVTGMGPVQCLNKHLEDPQHNNVFTSSVGAEMTVAVVALSCIPMVIAAEKTLRGSDDEEFRPIPW